MAKCALCETELRNDKAYMDCNWHDYKFKGKDKTICPECEKIVATCVVESY